MRSLPSTIKQDVVKISNPNWDLFVKDNKSEKKVHNEWSKKSLAQSSSANSFEKQKTQIEK